LPLDAGRPTKSQTKGCENTQPSVGPFEHCSVKYYRKFAHLPLRENKQKKTLNIPFSAVLLQRAAPADKKGTLLPNDWYIFGRIGDQIVRLNSDCQ